jgi:hypothetical protein
MLVYQWSFLVLIKSNKVLISVKVFAVKKSPAADRHFLTLLEPLAMSKVKESGISKNQRHMD